MGGGVFAAVYKPFYHRPAVLVKRKESIVLTVKQDTKKYTVE